MVTTVIITIFHILLGILGLGLIVWGAVPETDGPPEASLLGFVLILSALYMAIIYNGA